MKSWLLIIGLTVNAPLWAHQICERPGDLSSSAPSARFQDQDDGTVVDTRSRLMWTRCSAGQTWGAGGCSGNPAVHDWPSAMRFADDVNQSGILFYKDWRVPGITELASIAELACENPRINAAIFPATPPALYWTASSRKSEMSGGFAFALSFGPEGVVYESKQELVHVRLVRTAR